METNQLLLQPGTAARTGARPGTITPAAQSALGYLEAAGALLEHWRAHPREALAWPVLDTYRTGLELAAKDAIRLAACCLWREGARGADVNPGILEARLSAYTTLQSLGRHLAALLRRVPLDSDGYSDRALEVLQGLHALDSPGCGPVVVRREPDRLPTLATTDAAAPRDAHLEAVSMILTEAVVFLSHDLRGALENFLAVRAEATPSH